MKINVLGTEYTLTIVPAGGTDPKLESANGYTEPYSKEIVVEELVDNPLSVRNRYAFDCKTIRHELVHAFLTESGMGVCCAWAINEEVVDWIAVQFPKMMTAMIAAGALEIPKTGGVTNE